MKISNTSYETYLASHYANPLGMGGLPPSSYWNGDPPTYYTQAAQQAAQLGYSVPFNAVQSGMGAGVLYVNPDGSIGRIDNYSTWPLQVECSAVQRVGNSWVVPTTYNGSGGWVLDCSFVSPPESVWENYMNSLGVAQVANTQLANYNAAVNYATNAATYANPGVDPSSYQQVVNPPASGGLPVTAGGSLTNVISGLVTNTTNLGASAGLSSFSTWLIIGGAALVGLMMLKGGR